MEQRGGANQELCRIGLDRRSRRTRSGPVGGYQHRQRAAGNPKKKANDSTTVDSGKLRRHWIGVTLHRQQCNLPILRVIKQLSLRTVSSFHCTG
jgi:hypothetical protein